MLEKRVRWGLRYRFAEGGGGAGVAVPDGGGELVYGLLEVLLLPEPPPQLLEARLHRGLVRSGRRHGGRLWCGGGVEGRQGPLVWIRVL
jgi:hypothetical protein